MQLHSDPHFTPLARQSQYLLEHDVFLQLHFILLLILFLFSVYYDCRLKQSTQLQSSLHNFPDLKHLQ